MARFLNFEIETDPETPSRVSKLIIEGEDLTRFVSRVRFDLAAGKDPVVQVEFVNLRLTARVKAVLLGHRGDDLIVVPDGDGDPIDISED